VDLTLGTTNYQRLTLPPNLWFAFQGRSAGLNLMLNLASIPHDPDESDTRPLDAPEFAAMAW
jgi:dTDP-4-dehydrorhamnose 3,5-epimerase